ncbi:MAG TPA: alpha-glucosidase [Victivallales bacterium]|nr:alpha-glucosidase [Victivallales bacterium]
MELIQNDIEFKLNLNNRTLISHSIDKPFIFIGDGKATYDMYRGNFKIQDYLQERVGLIEFSISEFEGVCFINFYREGEEVLYLKAYQDNSGRLKIEFKSADKSINRIWVRINADIDEKVYGCGEQFSYFNLRGKNFPLWTSEPGVGRNKETYTTWQADVADKAGGDYYTTNYPQPTYVSSKKYFCHLDCTSYTDFDFRNDKFHELQCWTIPESITFETAESFIDMAGKIADFFGRQPELPEWVYNGVVLGIQGGTDKVVRKMQNAIDKGLNVAGLWCQDWEGINMTSFGQRLYWNWKWDSKRYPNLDKKIWNLKEKGIRFLGYITPFMLENESIFNDAKKLGFLAKTKDGEDYIVDFGEFNCGILDLTMPDAVEWYKKEVITKNLIDFGLDGWMADFGEYLPTDCVLSNGKSGEIMHNQWPALWAKANFEAVRDAGKIGEISYFMRAGFTGSQKYCTQLWAGDQCVDWCIDDGLASVIVAALSSGIMGNCFHHSDIGGYTTLHGLKRSKELFMRWADMAAFTPYMRTHEGNRPKDNHQFDTDNETLEHLIRMTNVFTTLKPYIKYCVKQASEKGLPVQRPLFMHYENDAETYDIKYQYMFGRDIIVAPVYLKEVTEWKLYLPKDNWINMWTGKVYKGGWITIDAPIGKPPVFYKKDSEYSTLFEKISKI